MSIATTVFAEEHLRIGTVELRCDKCGDIGATDVDNLSWHAAMGQFQSLGWAATGLNTHLCHECAAKLREEQADARKLFNAYTGGDDWVTALDDWASDIAVTNDWDGDALRPIAQRWHELPKDRQKEILRGMRILEAKAGG